MFGKKKTEKKSTSKKQTDAKKSVNKKTQKANEGETLSPNMLCLLSRIKIR